MVTPFSTPSYSNAAFTILGYALENITGNSLPDLFRSVLIEPLALMAQAMLSRLLQTDQLCPSMLSTHFTAPTNLIERQVLAITAV